METLVKLLYHANRSFGLPPAHAVRELLRRVSSWPRASLSKSRMASGSMKMLNWDGRDRLRLWQGLDSLGYPKRGLLRSQGTEHGAGMVHGPAAVWWSGQACGWLQTWHPAPLQEHRQWCERVARCSGPVLGQNAVRTTYCFHWHPAPDSAGIFPWLSKARVASLS